MTHSAPPSNPRFTWQTVRGFTILLVTWWVLAPTWSFGFTDRIVAVVNKEIITLSELQHEVQDEHSRLKAKYRGKELERRYTQKQREVLDALIDEQLQLQEATAKGISVTQEEIDTRLRRTPLPPTQTEEEFGRQLLLKKLFDIEVRRNIVVEEEELRRYYEAHPDIFRTPPQYRLKQILLKANTLTARLLARTQAKAIYADWQSDIVLEDLAAQHNDTRIHKFNAPFRKLVAPTNIVLIICISTVDHNIVR